MRDLLRETLRSLRAHALRFALTSLGIFWGALMLTYLSASMEGTQRHFTRELEEIGPKIIFMGPGTVMKDRVGERGSRAIELEVEDIERLEQLASVERISPNVRLWSQVVRAGRHTKLLNIQGLNAEAAVIRNLGATHGRFLTPLDIDTHARVAFLGAEAAERLFGGGPASAHKAVGSSIQIQSVRFRVIGVGEEKGDQLMNTGNPDDQLITIPYTTALRWFTQSDLVPEVLLAPSQREHGWQTIRRVRELVGLHHDFDPEADTALWFFDMYETLKVLYAVLGALRLFLVSAGIITLLVGAVGVMNIMMVVVGERTNEIGLRKAVGARSRDIFLQFLAEAVAVAGIAGIAGATMGMLLVQLTAMMAAADPNARFQSPPVLDPFTTSTIVVSLIFVAVVSGVVPAIRASQVPPSEALRAS